MKNFFKNAWSLTKKGLGFFFVKKQPTQPPTPAPEPAKAKKPINRLTTFLVGIALNAGLIFVATIIITNFTGGFTVRGIIASVLAALAILMVFGWNGIRELPPVHVGVPMILGDLSDLFLLPGGYSWILPKPFMDVEAVSQKELTLDLPLKKVLSKDSMEAEIDVQLQYVISDPYLNLKVEKATTAMTGLVERNVRWLANTIELILLPEVKDLFSKMLEGKAEIDDLKNHDATSTKQIEENKIESLDITKIAGAWGFFIKKAMVTTIEIPASITKAKADKEKENAERDAERIQNTTLFTLMKEFKAEFPNLSDKEIADLIQTERGKVTRTIVDGSAKPIVQAGHLAGGRGGSNP